RQRVELREPVALDRGMPGPAVGEEEDRVGGVERGGVGRPAAGVGFRDEPRQRLRAEVRVEALLREHAAGAVLVLAGRVARLPGHEDELLAAVGELRPLEVDVLEADHHRRSGVEL
ncbi:MAG: hypothetical protein ACK55I_20595, partial [bacterium]